jgi:nucleoside-diphosphate-sugar epimerase
VNRVEEYLNCPIVITGADGFVGRALNDRLQNLGFQTICIDSNPISGGTLKADITSSEISVLIPENAIIVHLAAMSTDSMCKQDPISAISINMIGTINLVNIAVEKKCKQFVFASSEWVYGDTDGKIEKNENSAIDISGLTSIYAVTKAAMEPIINQMLNNTNSVILRFGIVYGPREKSWSAVERLLVDVSEKEVIEVGSLENGRCFVYIDDLVDGIISSFSANGNQLFNLSGNELVTLGDVIKTSAKILSKNVKVQEVDSKKFVQRNLSNLKAKETLGWEPKIDLYSGLKIIAKYLKLKTE